MAAFRSLYFRIEGIKSFTIDLFHQNLADVKLIFSRDEPKVLDDVKRVLNLHSNTAWACRSIFSPKYVETLLNLIQDLILNFTKQHVLGGVINNKVKFFNVGLGKRNMFYGKARKALGGGNRKWNN